MSKLDKGKNNTSDFVPDEGRRSPLSSDRVLCRRPSLGYEQATSLDDSNLDRAFDILFEVALKDYK